MKTTAPLILASGSPRRKTLLEQLGLEFEVAKPPFNEEFPDHLFRHDLARFLAESKSEQCAHLAQGKAVLTADTIVCLGDLTLNKPGSRDEAISMLETLSDRVHEVITGICVRYEDKVQSYSAATLVTFTPLARSIIEYYVDTYQPLDKAGAYGIQEWIGMVGIEKIEGDYYNVVGLPVRNTIQLLDEVVGFA